MKECHYRGQYGGKPQCRIVGIHDEKGNEQVAFIHLKSDLNRYPDFQESGKELSAFYTTNIGLNFHRKGDALFVGFNFAYFKTLMLINWGFGSHACFTNGRRLRNPSLAEIMKYDASDEMVEMTPDVELTPCEAQCILEAMEDVDSGSSKYTPVLCMEAVEAEKDLWNSTKEFLKSKIAQAS